MLAAILKQLVQQRPSLFNHVEILWNRGKPPSFDEVSTSLRLVLRDFFQIFIVVDALDECSADDDTQNILLSEIRSLQAQMDLRLMVTSRPITSITQAFKDDLCLEIRASVDDVERYLEGQISRRPSCVLRNPSLQQLVNMSIVEAVDGM